tara:strand:+ start:233 stop:448 length:216 start_codon:yes stop_codon:yes gene_type:complete
MKFKQAIIYKNISDNVGIKFDNKKDFDTYCNKNNVFADNISINEISFYGWDEIELFFQCKNEDAFFDLLEY